MFWRKAAMMFCMLLASGVVRAQSVLNLHYNGYVAGLRSTELQARLALGAREYAIDLSSRLVGPVGLIFDTHSSQHGEGRWVGQGVAPLAYHSSAVVRGAAREIEIAYPQGAPELRRLIPPQDMPREPVPEALQRQGIDGLSALAMLLREVGAEANCQGSATIFDGRRVSRVSVEGGAVEMLKPSSRSSYSGPARRCEIEYTILAGLPRDMPPDDKARRPNHATAWIAPLSPGAPPVPVKMSVDVRMLGRMTFYLAGG